MSTGRGNSFARKLDGDCGWVKDPQQSGNATNNTPGETSDVSYTLTIVQSMDCDQNHGSIDIAVNVGGYTDPVFPMNYIIAYDADDNGIFDFSDTYTYGTDNTAPSVNITGLPLGRYKITVSSINGCFLHTFDVTILQCNSLLPAELIYFKLLQQQSKSLTFEWLIGDVAPLKSIYLEKSVDGNSYFTVSTFDPLNYSGARLFTQTITRDNQFNFYRLRLVDKNGNISYSSIVKTVSNDLILQKAGPNPVTNKILLQLTSSNDKDIFYSIYNFGGAKISEGRFQLRQGLNNIQVPVQNLPPGIYQLFSAGSQPLSFRFVKH
jgi:hypothetical protein